MRNGTNFFYSFLTHLMKAKKKLMKRSFLLDFFFKTLFRSFQ